MAKRKVSNSLALAVLALLGERPMHPYEMSTTLRGRAKESSIKLNYGSLYSVVEALQRHNMITVQEVVREGRRPERTIYAITEAGRAEFADWLAELLSTPVKDFTQFEAGLSLLPGLPPDDVVELLEMRCNRLTLDIASLRSTHELVSSRGLPRLFSVESEYVLALRVAELAFVEQLIADIRDGTLDEKGFWRRTHETGEPPTEEEIFGKGGAAKLRSIS